MFFRCNECYVQETFQRKNDILEIPDDPKPKKLSFEKDKLIIECEYNKYHANKCEMAYFFLIFFH